MGFGTGYAKSHGNRDLFGLFIYGRKSQIKALTLIHKGYYISDETEPSKEKRRFKSAFSILFPLDRRGWFRRNVIDHAIYAFDLIYNFIGDST
jgi:hypothetical protein